MSPETQAKNKGFWIGLLFWIPGWFVLSYLAVKGAGELAGLVGVFTGIFTQHARMSPLLDLAEVTIKDLQEKLIKSVFLLETVSANMKLLQDLEEQKEHILAEYQIKFRELSEDFEEAKNVIVEREKSLREASDTIGDLWKKIANLEKINGRQVS